MGQPKTEGQTKKGKCPLTDFIYYGGVTNTSPIKGLNNGRVCRAVLRVWLTRFMTLFRVYKWIKTLQAQGLLDKDYTKE